MFNGKATVSNSDKTHGCVPLRWSASGSVIRDHSDHGRSRRGVFLSVNPKTDFRSKNGFRVPFDKSKSGFLIWWILFQKGFIGFEIRRIQIQINGLVIYAVPFTVDPKLVRWSSGISSWSIPIDAVEFPRCCHLPQNIWKHETIVPGTLKYPLYTNHLSLKNAWNQK